MDHGSASVQAWQRVTVWTRPTALRKPLGLSGASPYRVPPLRPKYLQRRMSRGSTIFHHQLNEYALEMLRDSADFGGENDSNLGVALSLA